MPKIIPKEELDAIIEIIKGFPGPVSFGKISSSKELEGLPRRTLQRRLALLVESGRLVGTGEKKGRRYHLPEAEVAWAEEKKP